MAFHTKWKTPTFMWALMTLWQHDPKNCSTACGEIDSWSKFYNSWRTEEAQLHCRLKAQRHFLQSIHYLGKKKYFSSWNHTSSRQQIKLLFFQELLLFTSLNLSCWKVTTTNYISNSLTTCFLREKWNSKCLFNSLPGRTKNRC